MKFIRSDKDQIAPFRLVAELFKIEVDISLQEQIDFITIMPMKSVRMILAALMQKQQILRKRVEQVVSHSSSSCLVFGKYHYVQ
ncbi:hypothetical protein D3C81_1345620 [compost metagenome]